ncbi:polysaccharide deacetylase family protein [Fervidibacillus halotolerans]|uniref:Polysaccharide deacetylase family protein n=1 Tax=Fervidibacillus halotolerans TaxID=2980027 RepID=A0A9E8RXI6_9BACI|nr:polysaccharide deacetylase family protein [Fervidibacillus halotolerans]WAA12810.1 polysaccharide deacetylase family protein [Fervidibacillus halotolerans]
MKNRFFPILIFMFLIVGLTFIWHLKFSNEVPNGTIETHKTENRKIQNHLVELDKDKTDQKLEAEGLNDERTEFENEKDPFSSQEMETVDVQEKTVVDEKEKETKYEVEQKKTEADEVHYEGKNDGGQNIAEADDVQKETKTDGEQKKTEPAKVQSESTKQSNASNKNEEKIAYLTFDDGPSNQTGKILDILRQKKIKATFFVNGHPLKKDLYKQIVDDGHAIGNHTFSHNYAKVYSSVDAFCKDVHKLNDFLEKITGVRPSIIRFPGGSNNTISHKYGGKGIMKEIVSKVVESGYQYFDWNVSARDAVVRTQDKEVIIQSVLEGAKNKNKIVILMHDMDSKTTTVEALPKIIDELTKQGFVFDILDQHSYAPHFI